MLAAIEIVRAQNARDDSVAAVEVDDVEQIARQLRAECVEVGPGGDPAVRLAAGEVDADAAVSAPAPAPTPDQPVALEPEPEPVAAPTPRDPAEPPLAARADDEPVREPVAAEAPPAEDKPASPPRRGWWRRLAQ